MIDFENDARFKALRFSRGVEIPKWALLQIISAMPSDALLFHVDFAFQRNEFQMVFWSAEFEIVARGCETPTATAWVDTINLRAGIGDCPPGFMEEGEREVG